METSKSLTVHPDFQNRGVGRELMQMAIRFARGKKIGTGENPGEFNLFANTGVDTFYEKLGFTLAPNGMVLTDTESRKRFELNFQREWIEKRKGKRQAAQFFEASRKRKKTIIGLNPTKV